MEISFNAQPFSTFLMPGLNPKCPPTRPPIARHLCLIASLLLVACATPGDSGTRALRAAELQRDLVALGASVDPQEAQAIALAAIEAAAQSAAAYRPLGPAWANNALVNTGLRSRGLCFHWRNDLYRALAPLRPQTLRIHLAEAQRGTLLEHHALVLTTPGQPFTDGLLLDAWRHSGRLWWGRVRTDRAHPWQPVPPGWVPDELADLPPPG